MYASRPRQRATPQWARSYSSASTCVHPCIRARRGLLKVLVGLWFGAGCHALAAICAPVSSGYEVGAQVVYFSEDRSGQAPVRLQQTVRGADPTSFQVLPHPVYDSGACAGRRVQVGRDRRHVFYQSKPIVGADPHTFVFIDANYTRDKVAVYANARRLTTRVAEFRVLLGGYATDGKKHFYQDLTISGTGFELLGGDAQASRGYARTSTRVYHQGQVVRAADASSFEVTRPEVGITRDRQRVYFNDQAIPGADPKTFVQVHAYTFKDKHAVYTQGHKLVGLNPANVRASEFGTYLIDDQSVFKAGKALAGRDPATFAELQPPWSRDKAAVYYQDTPLAGVDLASFKATGLDRAEDRNYRYEGPRKVCRWRSDDADALPLCPP